jgi:enamine deaminase RidA (YjgF/YER057c/UK114 family)
MVFISGQVSMDKEGRLVAAGDFAAQARQVYANLRAALEGAGATPRDVVKLTTYVVDYKPELRAQLAEARAGVFGTAELPASTLVGIQALAEPGYLLEVEAIAITD